MEPGVTPAHPVLRRPDHLESTNHEIARAVALDYVMPRVTWRLLPAHSLARMLSPVSLLRALPATTLGESTSVIASVLHALRQRQLS